MRKIIFHTTFIGLVIISSINIFGQRQTNFILPQDTDSEINLALSRHYIARDLSITRRNQLMVFFPGTGGTPLFYRTFTNLAADMGFDAIGLSYVNNTAVNKLCGGQTDLDCYGNVRLEGLDGTDRSNLVTIDRTNSIENRLIKLLIYLENQFPNENWEQYLTKSNQIKWDKIVVAGHSQGGGVAGIIAKNHIVARSIMFAAMDFNAPSNSPANWILAPSVSPNSVYYGFSHTQDELVNYTLLTNRVWTEYGMNNFGAIINVEANASPFNNTHSLNTSYKDIPNGSSFHGAVVADTRFPVDKNGVSIYEPVWRYLLDTSTNFSVSAIQFLRYSKPINRPPVGITTKYYQISLQGIGFDTSTKVIINGIEVDSVLVSPTKIHAKLPSGKIQGVGSSTIKTRNQNGEESNVLNF